MQGNTGEGNGQREFSRDDIFRRRLYNLRDDPNRSLREKIEGMLSAGEEYLGVEGGYLKRIDRVTDTHEVVASAGGEDDRKIAVGDVHEHAKTFCRHAVELDSPLALSDTVADGWEDDPAYVEHGLGCYLGAPVDVGRRTWGTVCFVDSHPKGEPFRPTERAYVELVAEMIETELEAAGYDQLLDDREYVIRVLNRVLRHDLRNGMNVVRGYATALAEQLDGEARSQAEEICAVAADLETLGETARQLETAALDPPPVSIVDIGDVVRDVADQLHETSPAADVSVTGPTTQPAIGNDLVKSALYELGKNALTHCEGAGSVEFHVSSPTESDDRVVVEVADDGPGLPDHERRVLRGESETPLEHGSGLGLSLVYWSVRRVGGEVDVAVDEGEGTTVSVGLRTEDDDVRPAPWPRVGIEESATHR